jgi:hypothetical protein
MLMETSYISLKCYRSLITDYCTVHYGHYDPEFDSWQLREKFLFLKSSRLILGFTLPRIQWVLEGLSGDKAAGA